VCESRPGGRLQAGGGLDPALPRRKLGLFTSIREDRAKEPSERSGEMAQLSHDGTGQSARRAVRGQMETVKICWVAVKSLDEAVLKSILAFKGVFFCLL
jgi:hypothetical protein